MGLEIWNLTSSRRCHLRSEHLSQQPQCTCLWQLWWINCVRVACFLLGDGLQLSCQACQVCRVFSREGMECQLDRVSSVRSSVQALTSLSASHDCHGLTVQILA